MISKTILNCKTHVVRDQCIFDGNFDVLKLHTSPKQDKISEMLRNKILNSLH